MIRVALRQFRSQAWTATFLLAVAAILLAATGPHIAHIYDVYAQAQAACVASRNCGGVSVNLSTFENLLQLIGTALVAAPGLIGAFWGAPLITRELDNGTHRLAWTQSVSRTRWLAVKLLLVGGASIVATGVLSLMVTWWSSPIDRANKNQFGSGLFAERNITPLGYAAFAFALGVTAGLLIRRTLPAMATTLLAFLAVRLGFTYLVRPHLVAPLHTSQTLASSVNGFGRTNDGPLTLMTSPTGLSNAWIYSTRIVDASGHQLTTVKLAAACPDLVAGAPPAGGGGVVNSPPGKDTFRECVTKLGADYHTVVTYQPASRYWLLQSFEMAIFLVAGLALAGFCLYRLRRRSP